MLIRLVPLRRPDKRPLPRTGTPGPPRRPPVLRTPRPRSAPTRSPVVGTAETLLACARDHFRAACSASVASLRSSSWCQSGCGDGRGAANQLDDLAAPELDECSACDAARREGPADWSRDVRGGHLLARSLRHDRSALLAASGPRSMIRSAVLMTSRSARSPPPCPPCSTSRTSTSSSRRTSAKWRPVVGSSRMYSVRPVATLHSSLAVAEPHVVQRPQAAGDLRQ
jgi:hypothetical protein